MKKRLAILLVLGLLSCSKKAEEAHFESPSTELSKVDENSSSAAVVNEKDTTRKFVRTANLKFRVINVRKATTEIENITSKMEGFVTYTNLESIVLNTKTDEISSDSTLETTTYVVNNIIQIRVPNTKLDTTIRTISKLIDFLDFRVIKAEDVALQILSNKLTQRRIEKQEKRLTNAIDKRGKKLTETTDAEENLFDKLEDKDNAIINNLSLTEKIKFSTIDIEIYQRETVNRVLLENLNNISDYEPSFTYRIISALKTGWKIITEIFYFLLSIWTLLVLVAGVYLLYRLTKKNNGK